MSGARDRGAEEEAGRACFEFFARPASRYIITLKQPGVCAIVSTTQPSSRAA